MKVPQVGKGIAGKLARIVAADDQPAILNVISQILSPEYTIAGTYDSGPELLREITSLHPDLIILDVSMGAMSGFEVSRALRQMHISSPVLFLSIDEDSALVSAAIKEGAEGYVFKSLMDSDLKDAVTAILAGGTFVSHTAETVEQN